MGGSTEYACGTGCFKYEVILVSVVCLIAQKIFHQKRLVKIIKHRVQSLTGLLWSCLPLDISGINLIP